MQLAITPQNVIHVAFASVSLLGILLVLGKPQFKSLVLLLLCHACQQTFNFIEDIDVFPDGFIITPVFQLAYGPLYFLFVKNILYGQIQLRREVLHFIPFALGLFLTHWWWQELFVGFVLLLVYLALALRLLQRYEKAMAELTSTDEQFSFRWIKIIFVGICVVRIDSYIRMNLQPFLDVDVLIPWYYFDLTIGLVFVTYLIVKAVRQPELYIGLGELEAIESKKKKLEDEALDKKRAEEVFASIDKYIDASQRFLQPKFTLSDLADEMGLNEQFISWAINFGGGTSFSDYINGKRLEKLLIAMRSADGSFNILQNAMEVGFSSKSAFNAVFKRRFGATPSEYLKKL